MILPPATLGVLGGGQLGRYFVLAARELGYRTDPMNVLPQKVLGMDEFNRRLDMRIGTRQMAETRSRWK